MVERTDTYGLGASMVGYPTHWRQILIGSVLLAGSLEAAQTLTSTRHGRFDDFLVKASAARVGDLVGLAVAS